MKARLSRRHADDPDAFVVEELPVGRGDGRLDLAVVNGRIEGVEIKSCLDTLERLPRQIGLYGESVDAMTLVVARRHLDAAICIVPNWWQVFEATPGARGGTGLRRVPAGAPKSEAKHYGHAQNAGARGASLDPSLERSRSRVAFLVLASTGRAGLA